MDVLQRILERTASTRWCARRRRWADTSVQWARYGYRGAKVLLDRLDGGIAELVEKQATLSAEETSDKAPAMLDAYLNQLYRAAKSHRDGQADAARLDEVESLPWLLKTVFAMHGRLRPYNARPRGRGGHMGGGIEVIRAYARTD